MRDNRDPEAVGKILLQLKSLNPTAKLSSIADELGSYAVKNGDPNPSCIQRYGSPDDVKERWERIQIQ